MIKNKEIVHASYNLKNKTYYLNTLSDYHLKTIKNDLYVSIRTK